MFENAALANESLTKTFDENQHEICIFEDQIYKHKPGLRIDSFIPKHLRITNKGIYVYKDQYSANLWNSKPHVAIPLGLILSVQKVKLVMNVSKNKGRSGDWEEYQYKFAINLDMNELEPLSRYSTIKPCRKSGGKSNKKSFMKSFMMSDRKNMLTANRESHHEFYATGKDVQNDHDTSQRYFLF
jgi:hypothetical protein